MISTVAGIPAAPVVAVAAVAADMASCSRLSSLRHRRDVFGHACGESFHIVAAFEQRKHASSAMTVSRLDDPFRDLAIRLLGHAHAAEGVADVGVEAGGEEDRVRL